METNFLHDSVPPLNTSTAHHLIHRRGAWCSHLGNEGRSEDAPSKVCAGLTFISWAWQAIISLPWGYKSTSNHTDDLPCFINTTWSESLMPRGPALSGTSVLHDSSVDDYRQWKQRKLLRQINCMLTFVTTPPFSRLSQPLTTTAAPSSCLRARPLMATSWGDFIASYLHQA